MSAHTPGPWEWQTSNSWRRLGTIHGDGNVMYPCVQRDGHPDVTFLNGGFEGPDARLIAAAPQLLEALEEAVASGMVPVSSAAEGGAPAYSRVIRAADQIRAAIKAAKGEA